MTCNALQCQPKFKDDVPALQSKVIGQSWFYAIPEMEDPLERDIELAVKISPIATRRYVKYSETRHTLEIDSGALGEVNGTVTVTFELDAEIPFENTLQNDRKTTYTTSLIIIGETVTATTNSTDNFTNENKPIEASDELLASIKKLLVNSTEDTDNNNGDKKEIPYVNATISKISDTGKFVIVFSEPLLRLRKHSSSPLDAINITIEKLETEKLKN